jgi:biopolymer transport protein ExbD
MSRRRKHNSEEILMVPFLDILCSLIGVLVLIIVFLAVSQTTQTEGRTQEEVDRAIQYKSLNQKKKAAEEAEVEAKPLLTKLATLEEEKEAKESQAARLRKLISEGDASKVLSENLLKELDNLLLEITGYDQQTKDLKKQVEELAAEIKKRNLVANTPPPVIIQPAGSGMAEGGKTFFVEASGGKIVIYWNKDQQTRVARSSSSSATTVSDPTTTPPAGPNRPMGSSPRASRSCPPPAAARSTLPCSSSFSARWHLPRARRSFHPLPLPDQPWPNEDMPRRWRSPSWP